MLSMSMQKSSLGVQLHLYLLKGNIFMPGSKVDKRPFDATLAASFLGYICMGNGYQFWFKTESIF